MNFKENIVFLNKIHKSSVSSIPYMYTQTCYYHFKKVIESSSLFLLDNYVLSFQSDLQGFILYNRYNRGCQRSIF